MKHSIWSVLPVESLIGFALGLGRSLVEFGGGRLDVVTGALELEGTPLVDVSHWYGTILEFV